MTALLEFVAPPAPSVLSSADLWRQIKTCDDADVLQQWQTFGTLLLAEVQARTASLDAKATGMLGWGGAAAAGAVGVGPLTWWSAPTFAAASVALLMAFMALRVRTVQVPSHLDWFSHSESCEITRLRRFHLLSLRDWHEHDSVMNRKKGAWLTWGQWALVAAVASFCLQLVFAPR